MAIKFKRKCEVDDEVIEIYKDAANMVLRNIYGDLLTMKNKAGYLEKYRGDIGRLNDVVKGVSRPGRGIDLELTRLRNMDFESIGIYYNNGKKYLVAHTKDLIISTSTKTDGRGRRFDHGDYKVYVDADKIGTSNLGHLQFVPDLAPLEFNRHYHHTAAKVTSSDEPLDMKPNTCWSSFAAPISKNQSLCDLPELFRLLRIFVGRYNPGSPLSHPRFGIGEIK